MISCDVLVVGGGGAGLRAAIAARHARPELTVAVLSKVHPLRSHTVISGAGINAALGDDDSAEAHARDTVQGGAYLNDQDAVETLCAEAPRDVYELEHWGVPFNRDGAGRLDRRRLGGASAARACFVADMTGRTLLHVLWEQALRAGVNFYNEWLATSLLIDGGRCLGVAALELRSGRIEGFAVRSVVLATGGYSRVYGRSTASLTCTGDGLSLAARAGVALADMELIQWHPTVLRGRGAVVSEAALAEGARLLNGAGESFLDGQLPSTGSGQALGSRDDLCRAIEGEIAQGRGADGAVLLDARHLGADRIAARLPETRELVLAYTGLDLAQEPVPVRPAAHRGMGGIEVDLQGATSLPGLLAAGECACVGFHGANRLAGNTLLEAVAMGRRAGGAAATLAAQQPTATPPATRLADEQARVDGILHQGRGGDSPGRLHRELGETMDQFVGMERDEQGLAEAAQRLARLQERWGALGVGHAGRSYNGDLVAVLELGCMLEVAGAVAAAARARQESRGSHRRTDFPARDDAGWLRHTQVSLTPEGASVGFRPVAVTRWQPGRSSD